MSNILEIKDKVQRWLMEDKNTGQVSLLPDGYRIINGNVPVHITFEERDGEEPYVLIRVTALTVWDAPMTPESQAWLLEHNNDYIFGRFAIHTAHNDNLDRDVTAVLVEHLILGDTVDPDEFLNALYTVAIAGDSFDDEFIAQFGGEHYIDD
ncbi:T3SS (YopN, CesT) and YbjN peptide-binding chaperone 1 [Corynebacterium phoceense]